MESVFAILLVAFAVLVAAVAAWIVWRIAPTRRLNRRLAIVLAAEAAFALFIFLALPADGYGSIGEIGWIGMVSTFVVMPWLYLRFLPFAIDTPLVAGLRRPWAQRLFLAPLLLPVLFFVPYVLGWGEEFELPPIAFVFFGAVALVPLYALVASFHAWRRAAPGSPARSRARSYLTAFAVRDVSILVTWIFIGGVQILYGNWEAQVDPAPLPPVWIQVLHSESPLFAILGILVYIPLLAYGVLKTQLFDLDIKIKAGIRTGALTAIFVVVFFLAEQLGQSLISERAGPWFGLAGAGALAIAIEPLRRATERIAQRAMPHVDGSAEYVSARKLEVYRAAVEAALEDDVITAQERALLYRLAGELGVAPDEIAAIESDVRAARSVPTKVPS